MRPRKERSLRVRRLIASPRKAECFFGAMVSRLFLVTQFNFSQLQFLLILKFSLRRSIRLLGCLKNNDASESYHTQTFISSIRKGSSIMDNPSFL